MKVFISYSSKNRALVQNLADDLEELGHEVWFDKDLSGGQAWWDTILASIRGCDLFVFALTPEALESHPCQLEYAYAQDVAKHILPVMVSEVSASVLPSSLSKVQFVDYRTADHESAIALSRAISSMPPPSPLPNPLPPTPDAPISPLARIRDQIDGPTLTRDTQAALIAELGGLLTQPETMRDARQLLVQLRSRSDLMTDISAQIDTLLRDRRYQPDAPTQRRGGILVISIIAAILLVAIIAIIVPSNDRGGGVLGLAATSTSEGSEALPTKLPASSEATGPLPLRVFNPGSGDTVIGPTFSPDGKQIAFGYAREAWIIDAQSGDIVEKLTGHIDTVEAVAYSPDGKTILTGSADTTAKLWDAQSGQTLQTFMGHTGELTSVAFSPDGTQVLTGSQDDTARLWDVQTGKNLQTFSDGTGLYVTSVAFAPDGKTVITGSVDFNARRWLIDSGQLVQTFSGHTNSILSVAISPDGSTIATGGRDNEPRLWDAQTGTSILTLSGHSDAVYSVAFSPDGKFLLTGSTDETARLWDAHTGNLVQTINSPGSAVYKVAFSPDGATILTVSGDSVIRLWAVSPD